MKIAHVSFLVLALSSVVTTAAAQEPLPPPEPPAPLVEQPAPERPVPPPPVKKSVPIEVRVDGGYGLRTLEKLSLAGGDFGLALGAQPARHVAVYGGARGFFGSTELGLGVRALRVACDVDLVFDRLRIGLAPGIFVVGVSRVTRDQTIVTGGPTIGVAARVDVVRADVFALFLRAAADAGPTFADRSLFGGVTLGAGIDFDVKAGDRGSL